MTTESVDYERARRHSVDLEYTALRSEITKRIELRQQIVTLTLTLAGIFLGVGLTRGSVALIYPPLATFLALAWAQNDYRIRRAAKYIRDHIESSTPGFGYETFLQAERESKTGGVGGWRFLVLSYAGILLITQVMAVGIDLPQWSFKPVPRVLLVFDLLAMVAVIWLMGKQLRSQSSTEDVGERQS